MKGTPHGLYAYNDGIFYWLSLGDIRDGGVFGIEFDYIDGQPHGTLTLLQMLYEYDGSGVPPPSNTITAGQPAQLDSGYPYGPATDTPQMGFLAFSAASFKFKAKMYLMWTAPQGGSIPVPLATVDWGFTSSINYGWIGLKGTVDPAVTTYGVNEEPIWQNTFQK